jgi:lipopolysaccharide transport system ATP-binding protein
MNDIVIQADNLSKLYRLGVISTGTLYEDLNRWWAILRGRPDPTLRVDQVKKDINRSSVNLDKNGYIWALNDISFKVRQGEILGIIGSNGSGKSTLLKILSRVTAPTTGRCRVKGRIASLLEVGTGFHPDLTGRENIFLNGAILGMSKGEIRRKFDEIVAFSEIEKHIDTPVKRYSSGMYVRLAFAVAAHLEPEILIVDEVLAVGDVAFQRKCMGKMGDVAQEGRTVLFVSHNMKPIESLCNYCLLLKDGMVLAYGPADTVVMMYLEQPEELTRLSLADRHDRSGNGKVRHIKCELSRSPQGPPISEFFVGDEIYISVRLKSKERINVWTGITITDSMGNKLMHTSNRTHGLPPFCIDGENTFVLHIPHCAFLEGQYRIELATYTVQPNEVSDHIENAAMFSILPKDLYESGFPLGSFYGIVHLPNEWLTGDFEPILHE